MSQILITSFEPFTTRTGLVLTHNPTKEVTAWFEKERPDIATSVLPVAFSATRARLLELFSELAPRVWIGLGYAPGRESVGVETVAVNIEHASRPDNDGDLPNQRPIIVDAPLAYRAPINGSQLAAHLCSAGFDAGVSFHAGTFMCNQVFYLGCHQVFGGSSMEHAGFIHIPPKVDSEHFGAALAGWVDAL
jgi:pyroglutamyl-peptidase